MNYIKLAMTLAALFFLQACENSQNYPVSGEPTSHNDPVREMTAHDFWPHE